MPASFLFSRERQIDSKVPLEGGGKHHAGTATTISEKIIAMRKDTNPTRSKTCY